MTPENIAKAGTEASLQIALFAWAALEGKKYPELHLLFHCPNGEQRSRITGARLKAMGTRAGIPDIIFPVARRGYHALYLEMKTSVGVISNKQKWWMERLTEQGNLTKVCRDWQEARDVLIWYLTE